VTNEAKRNTVKPLVRCPDCGGDGRETCNNPDHGLIDAMGHFEMGRLGCPCCGHDPKHKVINGGKCETCNGTGVVTPNASVTGVANPRTADAVLGRR
jgi:hypothetical protein